MNETSKQNNTRFIIIIVRSDWMRMHLSREPIIWIIYPNFQKKNTIPNIITNWEKRNKKDERKKFNKCSWNVSIGYRFKEKKTTQNSFFCIFWSTFSHWMLFIVFFSGCCKCLYLCENIPIIEQIKQTLTHTRMPIAERTHRSSTNDGRNGKCFLWNTHTHTQIDRINRNDRAKISLRGRSLESL